MQACIYRLFCYCYLACNKFSTMPCKTSNTTASDQICSKNKILISFHMTAVRQGYPWLCSDRFQPSSERLQAEQLVPKPGYSARWTTFSGWLKVACAVPGTWLASNWASYPASLFLALAHESASPHCCCCSRSDMASLLIPKLPLTNWKAELHSNGQCQCSTAKFHLPWYLVKVSLLPTCLSLEQLPLWGEEKRCLSVSQFNEVFGFSWFLFLSTLIFPSVCSRKYETTFFSYLLKHLEQSLSFWEVPSIVLKI